MTTSSDSPGASRATSPDALEHAGAVAAALVRVLVPPNEGDRDAHREAIGALHEALLATHVETPRLGLVVDTEGFCSGAGALVPPDPRSGAGVARLYRDGLRSIEFASGVDEAELGRLVDALSIATESNERSDEDTVTRLWCEELPHIRFSTEDEIGSHGTTTEKPPQHALVARMNERIATVVRSLARRDSPETSPPDPAPPPVEARPPRLEDRDAEEATLLVSEETLAKLRAEVEDAGRLAHRAVDIVCDLLRESDCVLHLDSIRLALGRFLRVGLRRGDPDAINEILEQLIRSRSPGPEDSVGQILGPLLEDLAGEASMSALWTDLHIDDDPTAGSLRRYLLRLPSSALAAVARRASKVPPGPEREVLAKMLLSRGWEKPDVLASHLRGETATEALEALRAIPPSGCPSNARSVMAELLGHEDDRVRAEAVRTIWTLSGQDRVRLLEAPLRDPSPSVRLAAVAVIEDTRVRPLRDTLASLLDEGVADVTERLRILHAVASLGGPATVACLQRHLGPRRIPWPMRRRDAEARRRAIHDLHDVEDANVRLYLEQGTKSLDRAFAKACRSALSIRRKEPGANRE